MEQTTIMEKIREYLQLSEDVDDGEAPRVEGLVGKGRSFYEDFTLRGIRVNRVDPGFISCTFKVPLRLTDRDGNLANGAIANLVDEVGGAVIHVEGLPMSVSVDMSIAFLSKAKLGVSFSNFECLPMSVSVDMSIAFLSKAKLGEELEITSRVLGVRGGYKGTIVVVRNKRTGEIIAEGRHSMFGLQASKL